jgi:L-threonylcarbamoyladenylate synthase
MPGPLTILLKKKNKKIFKEATNNSEKICCRIPDDKLTLKLIEDFGPIAGPSCNFSQKLTITNKHMLYEEYKNINIGVFLNDANVRGIESTIIEINGNKINILREGIIRKTHLINFLKEKNFQNYEVNINEKKKIIPGNFFPHYQINKPLSVFDYKEENCFHISYGNEICDFNLSKTSNINEIIKNYYYSLFLGDLSTFERVSVKSFPNLEEFSSLNNKLKKSLEKSS